MPLWNYTIIRTQIFILYFYAGLKKFESDWIQGYSMKTLSEHFVFDPFKFLLTKRQIDLWIVHRCGFILDLLLGFFMFFDQTRSFGFFFGASFHVMNSQMFHIGKTLR